MRLALWSDSTGARATSLGAVPSRAAPRRWALAQHFAIWLGLITTLSGFVGLAINPDFAVGTEPRRSPSSASTGTGSTGLRPSWWECRDWQSRGIPGSQIPYLVNRATTDAAVALWAVLDDRPLGLLFLPTNGGRRFHAVAGVATLGIVLGIRGSKRLAEACRARKL